MKPKSIVSVLNSLATATDAAVMKALTLAQWYESNLHVVHVPPSSRVSEGSEAAIHDDLVDRIARIAERSGAGGVKVIPAVLSGSPVRAIADYTNRVSADLVVVEKKARRGSGYWSAGSFAVALGKAVKAPTIAVPSDDLPPTDSGALFRNIVVATDFSEVSLRALSKALVLAQQSGGSLLLLHVLDGFPYETVYSASRGFRLMQDFRARVARVNRELRSLIPPDAWNWSEIEVATVSGLAHDAIVAAASERRADLLVLGLPRRARMEELATGSTVHGVLRRTTSPVLLVPGAATASRDRHAAGDGGQIAPYPSAFGSFATGGAGPAGRTSRHQQTSVPTQSRSACC